ncbi:hypothetical protein BBO99_00006656 [Phytophthora kernoviae]|uniref:Uncharacterized protein n=2 Tax=Phytophthora kernoviae TaxID=325452 RepID=A0A3R7JAA0_9STRA|nr:hypothetical protein G195_011712 [Phytophthora kernoviae 00238/432]KAG2502767.1 hypothetical protein JM18_009791 [Phytophthora kernoviae]KAG2519976.1 hypothetical protein JM16_006918 [Phytophthora kernoviae]RLN45002.1 hypothetical protein BBI17_006173 [Phytophthora kernoviae]RLN77535.1 hypothetical protein BBO99_00006656 [Phytophthora kernoviae]
MMSPPPAPVRRKLDMDAIDEDEASKLPSVYDLMQEVTRLQQAVRDIGEEDPSIFADDYTPGESYSMERTPPRKTGTNVTALSPHKNARTKQHTDLETAAGLKTPPTKRREGMHAGTSRTLPRPTRVAALTRENISLLPTPRPQNFTGSICGSQKSRTSVRTDGGAVFSRLYQPDFYKNREEKFKNVRDRRDSLNCSFTPRTNRRDSISSRDSIGSGSQASFQSAKTDVVNVSSRLYDPDYVRKRNARLQRMRQEREMRECTFTPTINANATATPRKKL